MMAQLSFSARAAPLARPAGRRGAVVARAGACPFSSFFKKAAGTARLGASAGADADTTLLARLGGDSALNAAIKLFYDAVPKDPAVARFFEKADMTRLKEHQTKFMTMAFTAIPDGYDVAAYMTKGHARLVREGLDETHFDVIAGHLAGALTAAGEPAELVNEAVGVVAPLRDVFKRNAEEFRAREGR